ncbi:MAG: hypothetical protein JW723_07635 [Bacteroidales bacterium]|nr:hypothetical protein [Bacteroidales bacterium]
MFLLLLIIPGSIHSQNIFDEKQKEMIIKHHIFSMTTWDYNYVNGKPSRNGVKTSYNKYDPSGNVIELITYKLKDTAAYETFKYNPEGKRTDYLKRKGVKIAYQKTSKYNDDGLLIQESGFDGASDFQNNYEYNNEGKLEMITYHLDDRINEKRVFEHEGDITKITVYNHADNIISYLTLRYDSNGNVVEEVVYNADNLPVEKKLYVYNNDGYVISEVKYRGDSFYYKLTYLYNSKGELTNIDEENPNEGRYLKKQFFYDENANLTEMRWRRNADEDFSVRTYLYDEDNICSQYETYYPVTKFRILTKLNYDYF